MPTDPAPSAKSRMRAVVSELAMRSTTLLPNTSATAGYLVKLAANYRKEGKFGPADALCKRAFGIWRELLEKEYRPARGSPGAKAASAKVAFAKPSLTGMPREPEGSAQGLQRQSAATARPAVVTLPGLIAANRAAREFQPRNVQGTQRIAVPSQAERAGLHAALLAEPERAARERQRRQEASSDRVNQRS